MAFEMLAVGMREFAFATDSIKLATYGVGPCVAIAGYDPITKKTLLMHVDSLVNPECVRQILTKMPHTSNFYAISCSDMGRYSIIKYMKTLYQNMTLINVRNNRCFVVICSKSGSISTDEQDISKFTFHADSTNNLNALRDSLSSEKIKIENMIGIKDYDDGFVYIDYKTFDEYNPEFVKLAMIDIPDFAKVCDECKERDGHMYICSLAKKCDECKGFDSHFYACSFAKKCEYCGARTDIQDSSHTIACNKRSNISTNQVFTSDEMFMSALDLMHVVSTVDSTPIENLIIVD
jgi:hypothetical protein